MQPIKEINTLEHELESLEYKLERLQNEEISLEFRIGEIKTELKAIKIKQETESLPTDLFIRGYKLIEHDNKFILKNVEGNDIQEWCHSPSLGELFDALNILILGGNND